MKRAIRGVNLGGWLVLERWMTPSLFENTDAVDEYTYCRQADTVLMERLERHRQTFVTKADFEWLHKSGIEAVRIPVGHWIFGDAEPYAGTLEYLDKAFRWAEETGIKVLISLHGAPGSQNGNDHSGCKGTVAWHTDEANVERTLDVIALLARRYATSPALLGISLLNEPEGSMPKGILKRFYREAYDIVRQECGPGAWVVFSDSFQPGRWRWVLHRLFYENAYIDSHQYRVFGAADKAMTAAEIINRTFDEKPAELQRMRRHHPVIIGEWSAALDAGSLRGLDAPGREAACRDFCRAQQRAYDRMDAWFYWNYTVESRDFWSFRDCYDKGWFDFVTRRRSS